MKSKANSYFWLAFLSSVVDPLPPMSRRSVTGSGSAFGDSFSFFEEFLPLSFFDYRVFGYFISSSNSELLDSDSTTLFFLVDVFGLTCCFLAAGFSFFVVVLLVFAPLPQGPVVVLAPWYEC